MFHRFRVIRHLLLAGLCLPLVACGADPELISIVIIPTDFTATLAITSSGTVAPASQQIWTQYTAIGYFGNAKRPITRDITNQVTWVSQTPMLVTIDSNGVARVAGTATGYTQITAQEKGFTGLIVSNSSKFTVSLPATTNFKPNDIETLSVVPSNSTTQHPGTNVNFAVVGKTINGQQVDLTNQCTWTSSNPSVAMVDSKTGVSRTIGMGNTAITATYKNPDGLLVSGYIKFPVEQ